MSALEDAATFAQDPELKAPLTAAIVDVALEVLAEEPTTDFHGQRVSLGVQVVADPEAFAERYAWVVSSDEDTVDAWISGDKDTALEGLRAVVSARWNAVAGIYRY